MVKFRWQLLGLLICLPVAALALGLPIPFLDPFGPTIAKPMPVPSGDVEMAWMHTTTNLTTWERFVSGCKRLELFNLNIVVDDTHAFREETTSVPEVVIQQAGRAERLRIRWYKLTAEATPEYWVQALARRNRPPIAVIGGGSSDRAADLARAMNAETNWHGPRPLLFITTATAEDVDSHEELIQIYKDRSFRFCFTNRQMAESVLDFVWQNLDLRPISFQQLAFGAVASAAAASLTPPVESSTVFCVSWQDDPYSIDLAWQFKSALRQWPHWRTEPEPRVLSWQLPYSVGGFSRPNLYEARNAASMLDELNRVPPQRSLMILPTITQPARRLLRRLSESSPQLGQRLVAVSGDGIPVNALYRDGALAWPVHSIPVPLVIFTHHNPLGWDDPASGIAPPAGYALRPPNSTEDVLHFAEMMKAVVKALCRGPELPDADSVWQNLHNANPPLFDAVGNRLDGTGEFVVVFTPKLQRGNAGLQTLPSARLEVWQRGPTRAWTLANSLEVQTIQAKTERLIKEGP